MTCILYFTVSETSGADIIDWTLNNCGENGGRV